MEDWEAMSGQDPQERPAAAPERPTNKIFIGPTTDNRETEKVKEDELPPWEEEPVDEEDADDTEEEWEEEDEDEEEEWGEEEEEEEE